MRNYRPTAAQIVLAIIFFSFVVPASWGQKSRTQTRTLTTSSGVVRSYLIHVPPRYSKKQKKRIPLVFMLHGRGGSPKYVISPYYGNWPALAEKENFIAVFPEALGNPTIWKSWGGKRSADCQFLSELIDHLLKEYRIDSNRVYMTGHSSGGYMSYCFAVNHPEKVAAIGNVAGLMIDKKKLKVPVSLISFHGMKDKVVAYDQIHGKDARHQGRLSALQCAEFFASSNKAVKTKTKKAAKGSVLIDRWSKGTNMTEVVFYSLKEGGHTWPRAGSRSLDATKLIWNFFKSHPRPVQQKTKRKPAQTR